MTHVSLLIIGSGTAATNAARAAMKAGATDIIIVHKPGLINTCVEEGCMPSKSILAGAHQGEDIAVVLETRDAHIARLRTALTDGFTENGFTIVIGTATFRSDTVVVVTNDTGETLYQADKIIIAAGSSPFVPPIPGLDPVHKHILVSDEVVSDRATFASVPHNVLTIGGGPIGLELSTFFHDMGSHVDVLQRGQPLGLFDPEFGAERLRASQDPKSFPILINAQLQKAVPDETGVMCTITCGETTYDKHYSKVLVATGRHSNGNQLGLDNTTIALDERGNITHDQHMQTSVPHIYVAGDVTGHHQILHFAAAMGKVAGHNAANDDGMIMDYDKHMLAVSFDQFPSALVGLTETEARKRGMTVVTATKAFNSIGLGILKRQEYGLWKLVAEQATGKIIGSQVLGPDSAGELVQLLVPLIHNENTVCDILNMTWYHPTYAEILYSLARDIAHDDAIFCPGV